MIGKGKTSVKKFRFDLYYIEVSSILKVSKFQKQIFLFSFELKNEQGSEMDQIRK